MTNRKKRLQKGIDSLQEQIFLHNEKRSTAESEGNLDLVDYYTKEIKAKEETKRKKQEILDKQ